MSEKKVLVVGYPTKVRKVLINSLVREGHDVIVSPTVVSQYILKSSNMGFDLVIVEVPINPTGSVDEGAEWARTISSIVKKVVVFSLTKLDFKEPNIRFFDKNQGHLPLVVYISCM